MRICVAQTKPVKGDIEINISNHKKLIDIAISNGADTIIFPELSITGYEPELAKTLAIDPDDKRFDDFKQMSDVNQLTIGVGVTTKNDSGICISMLIFQPGKATQTYHKKYLHATEEAFFIGGKNTVGLIGYENNIAIAICYELSVPAHAENAYKMGAEIYIASVVESFADIEKALKNLTGIANKYAMPVLMANCVGHSGNYDCAGRSSVWNSSGLLLAQLNDAEEGILIFDTNTDETIAKVK
ncbi:carbon-nitrogen hydrolase family protein [soil metagenome]